ncbi:MAG TPA: 50S ribosomal protein L32 [Chloroflexi bacterium]|nr:50S ribosomal protein L32 [Chloroflexota bacterium]
MGAVPKRKISRGRRNRRRSHHALALPHLVLCPQCKEPMLPHRACPSCGTYRGREVIEIKEK